MKKRKKNKACLIRSTVAMLFAAGFAVSAAASPAIDCPLRDQPYSAESPLIDLLLNPTARAIIESETGLQLDKAPAQFIGTQAPTFAAILTLREGGTMLRMTPETIDRLDGALQKIPVTDADREARCARYDNDRPDFDLSGQGPKILLFEKINGFKDVPSFDAAHALFQTMAKDEGWQIYATDKGGSFTPDMLARFDLVIWNNISGDVLTVSQRKAFVDYIEAGGAYLGVHGSAGDPVYFWDWYADTLLGARFAGHPMDPQFQDAALLVEDAGHPAVARLPDIWTMNDEWYSFKSSPRGENTRVLLRLDEDSYDPAGFGGQDLKMGDHPIAWTRCIGKGRMFYSAIGHRPETYADPRYGALLTDGMKWAMDDTACESDPAPQ